ncbi:GTA-gp10 family protein [Sinorhizobium medicae]|uniref:GTA-gp10 family protein n=1 Tax=Sinorhizobium medicae TaxID=110321 RepID=UPI002AF6A238|nr:GTA-gp10 family protein [Sinorhizobium medicae]WQO60081.1 GTA-gp10 family protein [Sinorhizobium medicae]
MTDPFRNEVAITLAGKERVLRADFTAIRAIERDTSRSMIELQARGILSVTEMAKVIFHGLQASGDKELTVEQVGNAILEKGYASPAVMDPIVSFLNGSMAGFSLGKSEEATDPQ